MKKPLSQKFVLGFLFLVATLMIAATASAGVNTTGLSSGSSSRRTPQSTSTPQSTTTPTGSPPAPTSTPTGPQPTLTLQASTTPPATATPQPLIVITAGFSCTNGVCTLGPGNVGTFFNEYVTSSGGSGPTPYTWKLVSGSLPSGLSLSNFGVYSAQIAGTPKQTGISTFTLQVTDGAGDTARQAFTLTIDPPLPLVITSGSCCPAGTVGTAYHTNFFASGGVQPYTWSIISGQIPPGLRLAASPPAGLSGTPTTAGTYTFTVAVTDSTGTQTTEPGSITVQP
jgi:Putative Ig domain